MEKGGLKSRLEFLQGSESARNFAQQLGMNESTYRSILKKENPTLGKLYEMAKKLNVRLEWLADGTEPMRPNEKTEMTTSAINAYVASIDSELFQEVLKLVRRVYQEESVSLPADAISTATVQYYNTLMSLPAAPQDTEDLLLLLPWLEKQVRKDIRNAAAELGTGKHSA